MLSKRIIPCLDVKDGRTVKGTRFLDLKDAGDPVELGAMYAREGADELVFLDISATHEKRKTMCSLVTRVAEKINIPFTVGGGIASVEDVAALLEAGADKISINTAAVRTPGLLTELAFRFGSQCIVQAIDAKYEDGKWMVFLEGGRVAAGIEAIAWAKQAVDLGAGEILLTTMDRDGTKEGFALDITRQVSEAVNVSVIASGGAGSQEHFAEVLTEGCADAALAASVFHFGELSINELKNYLKQQNILVR